MRVNVLWELRQLFRRVRHTFTVTTERMNQPVDPHRDQDQVDQVDQVDPGGPGGPGGSRWVQVDPGGSRWIQVDQVDPGGPGGP